MKLKHLLYLLILFSLTITACSQKLPVPKSKEEGILVIPHKAIDEYSNGNEGFGYSFILRTYPESPVEIKLVPSTSKDYFIIENFPVGKYWIKGLATRGVMSSSAFPTTWEDEESVFGGSFEIKPNRITLLKNSFNVKREVVGVERLLTSYDIKPVPLEQKKKIIEQLGKLENAELWTLPES